MPLPTLVLLHGFPLDHTIWEPQLKGLSDVAHVLAPDLRGFGTDDRPLPAIMTMEDHAADVKALLDENGLERVVLGGLSMGGYVALAFAEAWPERLAGLLLVNTRGTADGEEAQRGREDTAQRALAGGVPVIARGMVPTLLSEATRGKHPELAAEVEALIARQRPEAVAAAARGCSRSRAHTAYNSSGSGKVKTTFAASSGAAMGVSFSSILIRLCACTAFDAL